MDRLLSSSHPLKWINRGRVGVCGEQEKQSRVTPSLTMAGHNPRDESGVVSQQIPVMEEQGPGGREEREEWGGSPQREHLLGVSTLGKGYWRLI